MNELLEFRALLTQDIINEPDISIFANDVEIFNKLVGCHNGKMAVLKMLDKFIDNELEKMAAGN